MSWGEEIQEIIKEMMYALGRRIGTARDVFSASLIWCRNLSSASRPWPSTNKCITVASQILLDDEADAQPKIEREKFILQRRVLVYDGICHRCHSGVKRIIKPNKDGKIKFCSVRSKVVEPYVEVCEVERKDVLRPGSNHPCSSTALRDSYGLSNCMKDKTKVIGPEIAAENQPPMVNQMGNIVVRPLRGVEYNVGNYVFYRGKLQSMRFARYGVVLEDKDAFKGED
ncbi:hypothetical protein ACS0TY_020868 [Phlomoides rotata]